MAKKIVCDISEAVVGVEKERCLGCCGVGLPRRTRVRTALGTIARCEGLRARLEGQRAAARADVERFSRMPVRETVFVDA
ncbi:hypothetical protein A3K55_02145 [Candidatus Shapirobacteria bacterium RBG_13_44_7]|uniref:Uncharacterized protein n=1 Tax=Candidatus Shapirobacteria bacterium RBG_13_44_7 TaxID=1802149 RepID=A0A1F7SGH4_9BACT|nr:MAG: hypothetical protein A3K55_02145 [Candidatus Shapirobacteria bacterium RBG_13_44_7]